MASNEHETLYLVDGSSYLYRAFHALPSLTAADGQPTGAIFGVANMVRRLIHERAPARLAVIFDAPGRNFRHEIDPDYKANRPPMPDDLRRQIEPLHEVIDAMGVERVIVDGVEADDVIATLVRRAREAGVPVLISSGDKDLAQLVGDDVVLEDTMQDKRYDPAAVETKFGVGPDRVGDLLALTGDASDNIPGVDKCGPKTAAKWLNAYGSLDAVIEHAVQFASTTDTWVVPRRRITGASSAPRSPAAWRRASPVAARATASSTSSVEVSWARVWRTSAPPAAGSGLRWTRAPATSMVMGSRQTVS